MRIGQWAAAAEVARRRDANVWRRRAGLEDIDPLPAFPLGEGMFISLCYYSANDAGADALARFPPAQT